MDLNKDTALNKDTDLNKAMDLARESGFTCVSVLDAATIELLEEVRQMCSANTCGRYGKNWSCPPACGDLAACRERVGKYHAGILVQTVGDVEDSLDFEAMMETEALHKEHFNLAAEKLRELYPDMLPLGAGCCTVCKTCTCPDQPCRFPEKRNSSLEAYGILVSELCRKNNLAYYYGADKIAYTSCYLLI